MKATEIDLQEINRSLNEAVAKSIKGSAFVLIVMYTVLIGMHLIVIPGNAGIIMASTAGISALLIAAIAYRYKLQGGETSVQLDLGLIASIILFNCILHLALQPFAENTLNFAMFVLGAGVLLISRRWFYGLTCLAITSWMMLIWMYELLPELGQWGWFMAFSLVIGTAFQYQRRTSAYALAKLNATHKRHAHTLKELVQATELTEANQSAMFVKIVEAAAINLDVAAAGIWVYDTKEECIHCVEFINHASDLDLKGHVIHKHEAPRYFDALLSNRVIAANDVFADLRTNELRDYLEDKSISSMLDAPISLRGEMWGVICLEHHGPLREWDSHEQSFAASIADVAAISVQGTENAKLEKRSRQTEQLESLGILAGGVAHDFNNLLTVVIGQSELVQRVSNEAKTRQSIEAVLEASHRAKDLAQQMLAYSGRATFLARYHCLSNMLKEFNAKWGHDLVEGVELDFHALNQELIVNVDATQIRQVITNLLTNARDSGAKKISLNTGKELGRNVIQSEYFLSDLEPDSYYAWVEIIDDGAGMSESVKASIFDPFFTTRNDGTGLGLAAVLGILKAHQGAIEVESIEDKGSRFRLLIPLAENARPDDCESTEQEMNQLPLQKQKKILLVEDEELVRELAETLLKQNFDNIISFGGVEEALSSIATMELKDLSAALIDLSLGDGNGLQVIEELKRQIPSLPIVLMSGYDGHDILSKLPSDSAVEFLHKPFTHADLIKAVQSAQSRSSHLH